MKAKRLALLVKRKRAKGIAIMESVATIKTHQITKSACPGHLIRFAILEEKRIKIKVKATVLTKMDINVVE